MKNNETTKFTVYMFFCLWFVLGLAYFVPGCAGALQNIDTQPVLDDLETVQKDAQLLTKDCYKTATEIGTYADVYPVNQVLVPVYQVCEAFSGAANKIVQIQETVENAETDDEKMVAIATVKVVLPKIREALAKAHVFLLEIYVQFQEEIAKFTSVSNQPTGIEPGVEEIK